MASARRVTVDLTEDASAEIERIRDTTGLSIADIFRHSFTLLRIYLEAKEKKEEMRIYDPKKPREQVRIELPTFPGRNSGRSREKQDSNIPVKG